MLKRFATRLPSLLPWPPGRRIRARRDFLLHRAGLKTKKCTIVDKKPVATEATIVGPDGVVYKTKTEAETAMKTVKVCTTS